MNGTENGCRGLALVVLLLFSFALAGCHGWDIWRLEIRDPEQLVFGRQGRHHVVNGCYVYMIRHPDGTEVGGGADAVRWMIFSPRYLIWEDFEVTYGQLPLYFQQMYPPPGVAPEPLQEGAVYLLVADWWNGVHRMDSHMVRDRAYQEMFKLLEVWFRVEDGRAVAVEMPLVSK